MTGGSSSTSPTGVWVLGGSQTDFAAQPDPRGAGRRRPRRRDRRPHPRSRRARRRRRRGHPRRQRLRPAVHRAGPPRRDAGHGRAGPVGRAAARHEAACASGGVALLAAMADIEAGRYDCALVLGVELEKNVPGDEAASTWAPPPGSATRARTRRFMWPHMFDRLADEYDRRYGLDDAHLRAIAELNFAQRQGATRTRRPAAGRSRPHGLDATTTRPTRSSRAGSAATTAARSPTAPPGVVLVSDALAARPPRRRRPVGRASSAGATAPSGSGLRQKLDRVRGRALRAAARAPGHHRRLRPGRTSTLDDLDGIETHDCFTPTEYLAIDHFGITGPARVWKAVEDGDDRARRPAAGQPQRRAHRRRPPGRRHRRAHGPRRRQAGHRHRRRLPGRGRPDLRHAQHRRQHRHHRQLRRRRGRATDRGTTGARRSGWTSRSSVGCSRRCPPTTTTRTAPVRGGRRRPSGDADDLDVVEGEMPDRPRRRLPAQHREPGAPVDRAYHPFDGDGMVHVVGFRDGQAFYRNRFVRTDGLLAEQEAGRSAVGRARRAARALARATTAGARGRG